MNAPFRNPRRADWFVALVDHLDACRTAPYRMGRSDCFTMVIGAVDRMLGTAHAAAHAGKYRTPEGAALRLRRLGFRALADYARSILPEIHPAYARAGDIAVIRDNVGREHFAICLGAVFETKTESGSELFDVSAVTTAFKVG